VKQAGHLLAIEARLGLFLAFIYINSKVMAPADCYYGVTWTDKVEHFLAFSVLALLVDFSFPGKPFGILKTALLLLYGAGIEVAQLFVPFRDCSLADFIADVLGIGLYVFSMPLIKHIPVLKYRWDA
jgi:VanZ family protein